MDERYSVLLDRSLDMLNIVVIFLKYHPLSVSDTESASFTLGTAGGIGGGNVVGVYGMNGVDR